MRSNTVVSLDADDTIFHLEAVMFLMHSTRLPPPSVQSSTSTVVGSLEGGLSGHTLGGAKMNELLTKKKGKTNINN